MINFENEEQFEGCLATGWQCFREDGKTQSICKECDKKRSKIESKKG